MLSESSATEVQVNAKSQQKHLLYIYTYMCILHPDIS